MRRQLLPAIRMLAVLTITLGIGYPLLVTAVGRVAFHDKTEGSLVVVRPGGDVGSSLLGQRFTGRQYFHPRPSASGVDFAEGGPASGGSNLGPSNPELVGPKGSVARAASAYRRENGLDPSAAVPVDAVTASGSGLDPDISPANARLQADRVAKARRLDVRRVVSLISHYTSPRSFGFLGELRVNVLELNLALNSRP